MTGCYSLRHLAHFFDTTSRHIIIIFLSIVITHFSLLYLFPVIVPTQNSRHNLRHEWYNVVTHICLNYYFFDKCFHCDRVKNIATVTEWQVFSLWMGVKCFHCDWVKNVFTVTEWKMFSLWLSEKCFYCDRVKNVSTVKD